MVYSLGLVLMDKALMVIMIQQVLLFHLVQAKVLLRYLKSFLCIVVDMLMLN
nr:MAG TPA: hypothetical protein [Bacteriophage sp.]